MEPADMHRVFNKLHEMSSLSRLDLPTPEIVAVGDQTVGKSSLLEAFLGIKFNFIKKKIATRRPLLLQCERHKDITTPEWTDLHTHRTMGTAEIVRLIEDTNRSLVSASAFVEREPIILRLKYANCWNITLIDLPGLRANDVEGEEGTSEKIDAMVKEYLKKKTDTRLILFIENARIEEFAKSTSFKFLRQNATSWEDRTILCFNMFDLFLSDQTSISNGDNSGSANPGQKSETLAKTKGEIEAFIEDAAEYLKTTNCRRYYTSLPSDTDMTSLAQKGGAEDGSGWVKLIEQKEARDLDTLKQYGLDEKHLKLIGFGNLANHIAERLNALYLSVLPQMTARVDAMYKEKRAELAAAEEAVADMKPDKLIFTATNSINAVVSQLNFLLDGGSAELFEKYAMTYDEEHEACSKEYPGCRMYIPEMFDSAMVLKHRKLLGGAQYRRMMEEVEISLRCIELGEIKEDLILNYYMKVQPGHDSTHWMDVVSKITLEQTQELLAPVISKVIARARFIMSRLFELSVDTVGIAKYKKILSSSGFKATLQRLFAQFLDRKLGFLESNLEHYLDACAKTVHEWRPHPSVDFMSSSYSHAAPSATPMNLPAQTYQRLMVSLGRDQEGRPLERSAIFVFASTDYTAENVNKARSQIHFYFSMIRERFADNIVLLFDAYCKNPMFSELRVDGLGASFSAAEIEKLVGADAPSLLAGVAALRKEVDVAKHCMDIVNELKHIS